jgi:transposase
MATIAFVGLDVSRDEVYVCFLLADGSEPVKRWTIPNTQPGAEALVARLVTLCQTHACDALRIGVEATGLLWWHLACALAQADPLRPFSPQIFALNPQLVSTFRKNYGALPKTDHADAFLIAERVRFGRQLPAPFQLDLRYAPLQRLTRFRCHLVENLAREKGYFLTFLFLSFSTYGQMEPFSDPFGATSASILMDEDLSLDDLANRPLDELAQEIQRGGRGRFADPEGIATTLQRAAKDAYRLDKVLQEPVRLVLATTMATIRTLQQQLAAVNKTIAQELALIPHTLESVPGLGPVLAAGLIAEIGEITRFPDHGALAQYAGLTWTQYQSGQYQAEDTPLTKRGNAYLRYYLVEAANSVRRHCPEYTAYYTSKYAETPKHPHKRAAVLTARKLVRLIDALLRTQSLYQARPPRSEEAEPTNGEAGGRQRPGPQRRSRRAQAVE